MTTRPTLHLCIATGQNLANLIPALQLSASKVVVLETAEMKASAANLKRALESHGIQVLRKPFDDSSPGAIQAGAQAIAMEFGEGSVIFNATGGHKLMTLAMTEEAQGITDELHLLYAETRHQRLDWLKPIPTMEPMDNVLKIDDFLLVQGYSRVQSADRDGYWQVDADARAALTRRLGDESDKLARFFGALNKLAQQAIPDKERGKPFRAVQNLDFAPGGRSAEVLAQARQLDLLAWDDDTEIVFASEDSARYFGGGWLEEFVWLKLRGLKPFDFAVNLKVKPIKAEADNELDAVIAHRNRLLVVECKTLRFGRDPGKDADYIYKLAQLSKQVGGSMASSLLLSARPVDPLVADRARQYGVSVLAATDVKNFVAHVRDWMQAT
jgi:hypothetical protein